MLQSFLAVAGEDGVDKFSPGICRLLGSGCTTSAIFTGARVPLSAACSAMSSSVSPLLAGARNYSQTLEFDKLGICLQGSRWREEEPEEAVTGNKRMLFLKPLVEK